MGQYFRIVNFTRSQITRRHYGKFGEFDFNDLVKTLAEEHGWHLAANDGDMIVAYGDSDTLIRYRHPGSPQAYGFTAKQLERLYSGSLTDAIWDSCQETSHKSLLPGKYELKDDKDGGVDTFHDKHRDRTLAYLEALFCSLSDDDSQSNASGDTSGDSATHSGSASDEVAVEPVEKRRRE